MFVIFSIHVLILLFSDVCQLGQYFNNANNACENCPLGFYQNTTGLFYCLPCPVDKTTRQTGAIYESDCHSKFNIALATWTLLSTKFYHAGSF
jgi:hypothetical protein